MSPLSMYLDATSEEGDPKSIEQFLQMQYPRIIAKYPAADVDELVRYLGANGRESILQFERAIRGSIHADVHDIEKHVGITHPESMRQLLIGEYASAYGTQDKAKAIRQATMAAINPLNSTIVKDFYAQQAMHYMKTSWRPSCPFQWLIRKVAQRVVESIV